MGVRGRNGRFPRSCRPMHLRRLMSAWRTPTEGSSPVEAALPRSLGQVDDPPCTGSEDVRVGGLTPAAWWGEAALALRVRPPSDLALQYRMTSRGSDSRLMARPLLPSWAVRQSTRTPMKRPPARRKPLVPTMGNLQSHRQGILASVPQARQTPRAPQGQGARRPTWPASPRISGSSPSSHSPPL